MSSVSGRYRKRRSRQSIPIEGILIAGACIVALILLVIFLGRGQPRDSKGLIEYRVLNREEFSDVKVSYDLLVGLVDGRLPTKEEMAAVANHLRSVERRHDHTYVLFYLPGMKVNAGAFASAHHRPGEPMQVKIILVPDEYARFNR